MKILIFGTMVLAALSLTACGPDLDPDEQMDTLMDQRWLLESVGSTSSYDLDTLRPNHISFTSNIPNMAQAFAGCNTIAGRYELDGMNLVFDRVAVTKQGCEDMVQEELLIEALENTNNYRIINDRLEFRNDGRKLAIFLKDTGEFFLPMPYDVRAR